MVGADIPLWKAYDSRQNQSNQGVAVVEGRTLKKHSPFCFEVAQLSAFKQSAFRQRFFNVLY